MLCISRPLVRTATDWNFMQTFTAEIESALTNIEGGGVMMRPSTSKENPESGKGMITRVLTVTIDAAECRQATEVFDILVDDELNILIDDESNILQAVQ